MYFHLRLSCFTPHFRKKRIIFNLLNQLELFNDIYLAKYSNTLTRSILKTLDALNGNMLKILKFLLILGQVR